MNSIRSLLIFVAFALSASQSFAADFSISPSNVALDRNFEQVQLLVTEIGAPTIERSSDYTCKAAFESSNPAVVQVSSTGLLLAVGNGDAVIKVRYEGIDKQVPVHVEGIVPNPSIDFTEQIIPVLYKNGCNAGACHASQYGKGGFTLSVMGYDPPADHYAIARHGRGRRVAPTSPGASLVLQKPTMLVAHGGGKKLEIGSNDYNILSAWISQGMAEPKADARRVVKLFAEPADRVAGIGDLQQLRIKAEYNDGKVRDVTPWARFDSMDESVVKVTPNGLVQTVGSGQAPVMARFGGEAALYTVMVPFAESVDLTTWQANNFVDELAAKKFRELGITPSPLCDDATFLRRAYLDAIGSLPTVEQATAFLDSTDPNKRKILIDRLLGFTGDPAQDIYNDQYAALWSLKWADLIRNNSTVTGESGMWALHNWLKDSFRTNKKFDQFVQELITAKGSIFSNGPANYYRIANNPSDLAESTSQLFLGTRLQCAKCHHHPYEKYGQSDYYSFAAFFARVGNKNSSEFGVFGGETVVVVTSGGEVGHPKTGALMKPTPLDGEPLDDPIDRRIPLAKWLTSPENDRFARNIVNRYVAYLLGRGLVEPVDDMRSTNPPSNVELMEALAGELKRSGYDVKYLMRSVMNSRLYQLDSNPYGNNASDHRFYSHFKVKRLPAESLLDCVDFTTSSLTKHPNLPLGTRATELPDANTTNPFLTTFGKPKRATVCECERTPDENLGQALHLLNGDILATKIADPKGRIATLMAANKTTPEIINELYLSSLSRRPTVAELDAAQQVITSSPSPVEGYQDLLWALINSKQFLFVR